MEALGEDVRTSKTAWEPLEGVREPIMTWYLRDVERGLGCAEADP